MRALTGFTGRHRIFAYLIERLKFWHFDHLFYPDVFKSKFLENLILEMAILRQTRTRTVRSIYRAATNYHRKTDIKKTGPSIPDLGVSQSPQRRAQTYVRKHNRAVTRDVSG